MDEAMETGGMGYEDAGDDAEGGGGEKTYNPLKLPIGWDGKPIPFWMYKLHGLRVEYRCEICSDHVYKGRKVFEKHFQESRHAFGMRALGLPNTPEFRDVTRIQDAFALAEKLRQQKRLQDVEEDDTIEVEDEHGNVRMTVTDPRHIPARPLSCSSVRVCCRHCCVSMRNICRNTMSPGRAAKRRAHVAWTTSSLHAPTTWGLSSWNPLRRRPRWLAHARLGRGRATKSGLRA